MSKYITIKKELQEFLSDSITLIPQENIYYENIKFEKPPALENWLTVNIDFTSTHRASIGGGAGGYFFQHGIIDIIIYERINRSTTISREVADELTTAFNKAQILKFTFAISSFETLQESSGWLASRLNITFRYQYIL